MENNIRKTFEDLRSEIFNILHSNEIGIKKSFRLQTLVAELDTLTRAEEQVQYYREQLEEDRTQGKATI